MEAWWEDLGSWNQASYFVAGLGVIYLLWFVPWDWLKKIPLGPGSSYDGETAGIDLIDPGAGGDAGGGWPDFSSGDGTGGNDGGGP